MNLLQEIMFGQSKVKDFPKTEIISRMEAMQSRFGQLEDRKEDETLRALKFALAPENNRTDEQKAIGAYYDRVMNRSDNGSLDHLSDERAFDGEDAEEWQRRSEEQGAE